jgi:hypothetical protein
MIMYGNVEIWIHVFLISALVKASGKLQAPTALAPDKELPIPNGCSCLQRASYLMPSRRSDRDTANMITISI